MTRTILFAAGVCLSASIAASTIVFAQENDAFVGDVSVTVDREDIGDSNALDFWPNIAADLQTALETRAMPIRAENGTDISVQLRDISLSGSNILTGEGEFNHIEGWVYFRRDGDTTPFEQEEIVLDASTLQAGVSEQGLTVPDVPVFYSALIDAFALATLEKLAEQVN